MSLVQLLTHSAPREDKDVMANNTLHSQALCLEVRFDATEQYSYLQEAGGMCLKIAACEWDAFFFFFVAFLIYRCRYCRKRAGKGFTPEKGKMNIFLGWFDFHQDKIILISTLGLWLWRVQTLISHRRILGLKPCEVFHDMNDDGFQAE